MMKITDGVTCHILKMDKFKDIGISIRFMSNLTKATATPRSLLALMMVDRCERYNSKKKMNDHQDYLYGATMSAQTIGYGQSQVVELRCRFIHPSYINKQSTLLDDVLCFLKEIIFHPYLEEASFQEAKEIMKAKITRMLDDPSQYVIAKGFELGGRDQTLAISAFGDLETLETISLIDIKNTYDLLMKEDAIEFIVCGEVEEKTVTKQLQSYFPFTARHNKYETYYTIESSKAEQRDDSYRDVQQSNILLLWYTHTTIKDPQYHALRVACAMFGQYSSSLLFQEVREKHSLCYSISANLVSFDGAMAVTTGVETKNIDRTIALIKEQFQRICNDDFDDALLDVSKTMIINSLSATKDAMNSLIALQYQNAILQENTTADMMIELIKNVKKEDVIKAFQRCALKEIYVLQKEEDHATNV